MQLVDALFAVVMAAREDLWLIVMLVTDATSDLLLQLLCYIVIKFGGHSMVDTKGEGGGE